MKSNAKPRAGFDDHARKILFRTQWAKPILKFISEKLDMRLVYLGLPGVKALDVLEWKEYLKIIIAFQRDGYEEELEDLQAILDGLESSNEVEDYKLYIGYIEEIIISGYDNTLTPFSLSKFVTVHNLDFCNALTNPVSTFDKNGKSVKYFKIKAIERLLHFERERCSIDGSFFVMFLTVNAMFWEDVIEEITNEAFNKYLKENLINCSGEKKSIRLLKAYAYLHLTEKFKQYSFNIEILPTIYYRGKGGFYDRDDNWKDHWLLTFTILGTPFEATNPEINFQQDFKALLEQKFIALTDNEISCHEDEEIYEDDFDPSIHSILKNCFSNRKLWSNH